MKQFSPLATLFIALTYAVCSPSTASGDGDRPAEEANPREGQFFNLTVEGRRVIFVLDHSKSMLSQLDGQTRLERLRNEMDRFFETADGAKYFDIHCFNDRLAVFRKRLVHNTEAEVIAARDFLNKQPARGKTATFDALKSALIEGKAEYADRIIFLTDGNPTFGTITEPPAILSALRSLNPSPQIPIDVVAFDTSHHPSRFRFLQRLAEDHSGNFIPID